MIKDSLEYQTDLIKTFHQWYETSKDGWTHEPAMRAVFDLSLKSIDFSQIHSMLDIGCGVGKDIIPFASLVDNVVGLDLITHPAWREVQDQFKNIKFVATDFNQWQADDTFDLILDNGCFHHQHPDLYASYLQKIHSLLNENGYFLLNVFFDGVSRVKIDEDERIHRYFTYQELQTILNQNNFQIVESHLIERKNQDGDYLLWILRRSV